MTGRRRLLLSSLAVFGCCYAPVTSFLTQDSPLFARRRNVVRGKAVDADVPPTSVTERVNAPLPPVIRKIADERQEFNINLGRAMDTLRRDMPDLLQRTPGTCFLWAHTTVHAAIAARQGSLSADERSSDSL